MRRSLSGFEKAFCLSEPLVPINFALVANFTGVLDEIALRQALGNLRERYSMAAMRLEYDEYGKPCFTRAGVPDFPLQVIEQGNDDHWQQVAAQELGQNFDLAQGPLIRITLLKKHSHFGESSDTVSAHLVLTFHHGCADGMSAVYFLRDLLYLLNDPQADLPVMPPPSDLLSLIPKTIRRSLSPKIQVLGMKSGLWLMRHFPPFGQRFPPADRLIEGCPPWHHFALVSRCLTQAQTSHLATICREQGTSIHAAISTAWLRAQAEINLDVRQRKQVISIPVDLRVRLNIENAFGMYMSNVVIAVDGRMNRDFWTIAREIKVRLNHDIQTGRVYRWVLAMLGLMDSPLETVRQVVPAFATQPVDYDFSISNLGRLPLLTQSGDLKLEAVYGPIVNTSEREMTIGVSTACNRLTMTLTYRDFVLDPVEAEKMADKTLEILTQVMGW